MSTGGSTVAGWSSELDEYFQRKAASYDRVGDEPYWRFSDRLLWRHILANIKASLGADRNRAFSFLDAGGGTARWSVKLLAEFTAATGLVLDASAHMLEVARRNLTEAEVQSRCTIRQADLDNLDFPLNDQFELILCFHNVLGFVENPMGVLRSLVHRLTRDGIMLLVIPNTLHAIYYSLLRGELGEAIRAHAKQEVRFSNGPVMRTFTPARLVDELRDAGITAQVLGFPVTVYPTPSATFARADEAAARILEDPVSEDALFEIEWDLSNDPSLASRGNNLLVVIRPVSK